MIRLLLDNGANVNFRDNNGETALMIALRNKYRDIVKLLERHISSSRIQSRFRGRQTRRKARTQKALQQLQASRLPTGYDVSRLIGERVSRMPYNPEVAARIKDEDEERQHKEMADYLDTLAQYGGKKKRKKTKKKKSKKKRKSKKKK